jgi:DNA-binding beta-propeller fold protein YncE
MTTSLAVGILTPNAEPEEDGVRKSEAELFYVPATRRTGVDIFDGESRRVSFGRADGQFQFPRGITVDTNGNMYVADSGNNRGAGLRGRAALRWTWPAESP